MVLLITHTKDLEVLVPGDQSTISASFSNHISTTEVMIMIKSKK